VHYAASEDKTNVLVYLYKIGALLDSRDKDNKAPIDIALQNHKIDSITFLRLCKLSITKETVQVSDNEATFLFTVQQMFNNK